MATIPLSIKKDELIKIVKGETNEHEREVNEQTGELFLNYPEETEGLTEEQIEAMTTIRTDVEAIAFQVGRNVNDGWAIVTVNGLTVGEYADLQDKPTGEYFFLLSLGQTIKHNLTL